MLTDQEIIDATKPVLFVVRNEDGSIRSYGRSRPDGPSEAFYADDTALLAELAALRDRQTRITVPMYYFKKLARTVPLGGGTLFSALESLCASDEDLKFDWDHAPNIDSDDHRVVAAARALGISDERRVELFKAAQAIVGNT